MAKEFLSQRGVPFVEKDVSRDPVAAQELMQMGQRGVPVIRADGELIVGFNRPRLEQLAAQAKRTQSERPKLGASVANASRHAPAGSPPGAYVGRVRPGSTAARAGLQAGDIITMLAGQMVQNASDVERIMARVQPRSRAPVRVFRQGRTHDLTLEF